MSSSSSAAAARIAAVVQLTCTSDKAANYQRAKELITRAKRDRNASVVFLPEAFDFIGESSKQTLSLAEPLDGPLISDYRQLAKDLDLELSLGGFHEKREEGSDAAAKGGRERVRNTHAWINCEGDLVATYRKTHLYDVDIPERVVRIKESDFAEPGDRLVKPVQSQRIGRVGLGICYDLRFPEMSLSLAKGGGGADVLTYPSAFMVATGLAHWETLLRARAIECQCYVVAAAQTGKHNAKRSSYGHSMIVDPWGRVVAQCSEGEGVAAAPIDLDYLARVRQDMPVAAHRRHDLYGLVAKDFVDVVNDNAAETIVDARSGADAAYRFGDVIIPAEHVVLKSRLTYVIVNRKPVLPFHLLVIPLRRSVLRMADLSCEESADFFNVVGKAQMLVERVTGATSSTISIQDGPDAGQTMDQLHAHVLARRPDDFQESDEIYERLANHDKGEESRRGHRTTQEMSQEASLLREKARGIILQM